MNFEHGRLCAPLSGRPMASRRWRLIGATLWTLQRLAATPRRGWRRWKTERHEARWIYLLPVAGFRGAGLFPVPEPDRRPRPIMLPSAADRQARAAIAPAGAGCADPGFSPADLASGQVSRGQCLLLLLRALPAGSAGAEPAWPQHAGHRRFTALSGRTSRQRRAPSGRGGQSLQPHRPGRDGRVGHRMGRLWLAGNLCGGWQWHHPLQICRAS